MPVIAKVSADTGKVLAKNLTSSVNSAETVASVTSGLTNTVSTASVTATEEMVNKFKMAVDKINLLIEEGMIHEPVIRPVIDTTDFDAAIARMNEAISNVQARASQTQASVDSSKASQQTNNNNNTTNNTTNINLTQNNTSPKPLDVVEILRRTENMIDFSTNPAAAIGTMRGGVRRG
jgi:hypothetical protein